MKSRIIALVALSIVIVFLLAPPFHVQGADQNDPYIAHISFREPVNIVQLTAPAAQNKLQVLQLESAFAVGEYEIHDFYTLPSPASRLLDSLTLSNRFVSARRLERINRAILAGYSRNRLAFMSDIVSTRAQLSPDQLADMAGELAAMEQALSAPAGSMPPPRVTAILVAGEAEAINSFVDTLSEDNTIHSESISLQDLQSQPELEGPPEGDDELGIADGINQPAGTWYPNSGISYTYPSSSGGRYTQQYMKWNSRSFSSTQTYEHDYFLYNYDGQTYLDGRSTSYPGCFPRSTYAATSWPSSSRPYLDTRNNYIGCEKNELAFTIGAAQANALSSGKLYYTYLRTANGNASSDKFKLQGQLGHRWPTGCYSTWCSYGDQITNLVPAWSTKVPGIVSWNR